MTKRFLDSSIIFYAKQNSDKYKEFASLISGQDILLVNNLVKLEVLQGINYKNNELYEKFVKLFENRFVIEEINKDIYEMSMKMDRLIKSKGITLKQGKTKDMAGVIDIINFCTAKYYDCQIHHNDADFDKLELHYQELLEVNSQNSNGNVNI